MTTSFRSIRSALFLGSLLGSAACSGPSSTAEAPVGDFAAISPESEALDIAVWQAEPEAEGTRLLGIDADAARSVEVVVTQSRDEAGSVQLQFSHPELSTVRLFPDGKIEGEATPTIEALTQAIYQDLRAPELLPGAQPASTTIGSVEQALSTNTGSFSFSPNLFGHNGVRIVGPNPCPSSNERVTAEAQARNGRGRCEFDGFRTAANVRDCRIRVEYHINSLASETCDWSVSSD